MDSYGQCNFPRFEFEISFGRYILYCTRLQDCFTVTGHWQSNQQIVIYTYQQYGYNVFKSKITHVSFNNWRTHTFFHYLRRMIAPGSVNQSYRMCVNCPSTIASLKYNKVRATACPIYGLHCLFQMAHYAKCNYTNITSSLDRLICIMRIVFFPLYYMRLRSLI